MTSLRQHSLREPEAALWWLGQAGYLLRSDQLLIGIDPYLTDSAAGKNREFTRTFPPPLAPESLSVDIMIITHDHGDHLDPETLGRYPDKSTTRFIGPRHVARRLRSLGIPTERITVVEAGDRWEMAGVTITGVFALPTGPDVLDTTGYLISFANGRSVYHTSDTSYHSLLLAAAPSRPDVLLVPINGKWGNLGVEEALSLTRAIRPRYVFPNHYDLMALNTENPETFRWLCRNTSLPTECVIPTRMQPFVWSSEALHA